MIEPILYIVFGVLTTIINVIVFFMLDKIGVAYQFNNVIAFVASVVFAFYTNKVYVFKSTSWASDVWQKEAITFFGARLGSFAVDMGLMLALVGIVGVSAVVAKIITNVVVIVLNYILSKIIFK
ncbi:MAG: hypothetical protein ATN35_03635 [Epulopiscium sp. Nele67-Bin004]|nr:MAG: hypothetical protein ATN35_03635 [Epulopiscium sp. Nele67-Bin004]